jgi:protein-S-isoprenylcysteine O-methyltransferase Ste14
MSQPPYIERNLPRGWRLWARISSRIAVVVGTFAVFLFGAAGRIDWTAAWLVIVFFTGFLVRFIAWGLRHEPDLIRERSQVASNVKIWDKVINGLDALLLFSLMVVAGLDVRFGLSDVAIALQVVGFTGFVAAVYAIWRALAENPFASRYARIQDDRGQKVIRSGPYRIVRHPMYAAIILLMVCLPLTLGSWWALVPGVLICALFVLRTALEDRMLLGELPGYADYARVTSYRLLPGIW